MKERPTSLELALELAQKLSTIETAQKQLLQHSATNIVATSAHSDNSESNTVSGMDYKLWELSGLASLAVSAELKEFHVVRPAPKWRAPRIPPTSWNCGKQGHLKHDCQSKPQQDKGSQSDRFPNCF